ncbi:MAG: putative metal-binding motif-containing protein [Myxococcota bacterium]
MKAWVGFLFSIGVLSACSGGDPESTLCLGDAECGFAEACVDGFCVERGRCGDGMLDAEEECDDGNLEGLDGCEQDCRFSCREDAECDDGNPCNGVEMCDRNRCDPSPMPADGVACSMPDGAGGLCRSASCVAEGCGDGMVDGDEVCDDGNDVDGDGCDTDCEPTCIEDTQCSDGNPCNGEETCDTATSLCTPGTPLECDDDNPCTANECDPMSGCDFPLIDADGDGRAASSLGACGEDCDDTDANTYTGAEELCDGVDNNCDGTPDEANTTWYVDCDGDGYASDTNGAAMGCTRPAPVSGCGWTTTRPIDTSNTDCHDGNMNVFPGQTRFFSTGYTRTTGGSSFDYDCDGTAERQYGCQSGTNCNGPGCSSRVLGFKFGLSYCTMSTLAGTVVPVPPCGVSAPLVRCFGSFGATSCTPLDSLSSAQRCR